MGELGFFGIDVPEKYGGSELDDSPHPKTNERNIKRRSDLFITLYNGISSLSSAI